MVQLMKSREPEQLAGKIAPDTAVKVEVEDPLEEEHGSLHKRPRQQSIATGGYAVPASQCNPLDEPSPLGLRLRKSPSLLELIQMKLSQSSSHKAGSQGRGKKPLTGIASSGDKLKACNFPASLLRIGTWEYKSRYEGDLVAKCYFAKHKLVWEVLDGGLKNKIEIQWSDIMALKANYPGDGPETLDVVLARQPLFFRETNPQPRKHTLWQATSDFTGGQASIHKRHFLECPPGLLGKHIEKLTQCDPRLHFLSQQGEIALDSPYFESRTSVNDEGHEDENDLDLNTKGSPSLFSVTEAGSPSGVQSSFLKNNEEPFGKNSEAYPCETPSPCSVYTDRDGLSLGDENNPQLKMMRNWEQIKVPGMKPSMSMSDLVSHLENRISEQGTSSNPNLSNEEWESLEILDNINQCLFSDFQGMPESDEKSLMARVNSLCCLLQKDGDAAAGSNKHDNDNVEDGPTVEGNQANNASAGSELKVGEQSQGAGGGGMSRKDSLNDLLLNLPRIASLPQFLFNISEEMEGESG
ncbi:uncharacterized protein LOC127241050 isoform X2 [Andrographis paniculata]|uniref:uncharacterized protein LOC127241050 isoform X2 n=1 Tax=Andrographis paniculata TaxID=175694 RepID=UPI0021E97B78|nr:uncharacterized protein LOC127241050 isoform X2 [Andrographis paniculata]